MKDAFIKSGRHIIAVSAAMLVAATTSLAADDVTINPHERHVQSKCVYCHAKEPPALNRDPVSVCTKCHSANVGGHPIARHPIGKKTNIPIPPTLPVTENNEMVCYTCHEPHNDTKHARMLREEYDTLCIKCHRGF